MKQWNIQILLILLLIPLINALDLCEDSIQINTNCTMLTPFVAGCSIYNYSIYNATSSDNIGGLVNYGLLAPVNSSTYYFNFTEKEGKYVIQLCDGTTRLVQVKNTGDNTVLGIIILIPMILAALFLFLASSLHEEHTLLKITLFMMALALSFMSWQFGEIVLLEFFGSTALTTALVFSSIVYAYFFYFIIAYIFIYILIKTAQFLMQKKKERYNY
jgi:hypothetical protein